MTFIEPAVVVLSNYTVDHTADTSDDTVSLQVQFYVTLPSDASKSPFRQTNYVVPKATLNLIVEQESQTIEALVRDSVSPPLTQTPAINGWMICTIVLAAILMAICSSVLISLSGYAVYRFKKRFVILYVTVYLTHLHSCTSVNTCIYSIIFLKFPL